MPVLALFAPVLSWLFRVVVVKFLVVAAVLAVVSFLAPVAIGYLGNFLGVTSLNSAFAGLPSSVWYFADLGNISYGLPLVISAWVSRFLIRRLPFIG